MQHRKCEKNGNWEKKNNNGQYKGLGIGGKAKKKKNRSIQNPRSHNKTYYFLWRYNHLLRERSEMAQQHEAKSWWNVWRRTEMKKTKWEGNFWRQGGGVLAWASFLWCRNDEGDWANRQLSRYQKKGSFTQSYRQPSSQRWPHCFQTNVPADASPAPCPVARSPAPALVRSAGRFSASPDWLHYTELLVLRSTHGAKTKTCFMRNWNAVNRFSLCLPIVHLLICIRGICSVL